MSESGNMKKKLLLILAITIGIAAIYFIFSSDSGAESGDINKELPSPENEELPEKDKAYIDESLSNLSLSGAMYDDADVGLVKLDSVALQINALDAAVERSSENQAVVKENVAAVSNLVANAKAREEQEEAASRAQADKEALERKLREKEAELQTAAAAARLTAILNSNRSRDTVLQTVNGSDGENDRPTSTIAVSPVPQSQGEVATTLGNGRSRRGGFYGVSGTEMQQNSIKACAYGEQVVSDGQHLRLRLLEPMLVGSQMLPVGSILTGECRIGANRLLVSIASIEFEGIITRVALEVFDSDGQRGLYVPGSMEMETIREVGAEVAHSVGSTAGQQLSMFQQQSAMEQIKADVGRGTVQGVFRFLGKKLQEVKVMVQDKHRVFLAPQK
jgi:conjugative transposon TraM protein